ncbi:hypothetical protein EJP81_11580 [Rahnella aquatilis]|nr:hypothetical protein EJP79_11575 [Rahnella aquatilis]AZP46789.1 hypothetical protein EJP81_11580 [Rahnella aquatilis]
MSSENLYVRFPRIIARSFVPNIVIRTLRVTLLSDSGYALTGYEYCARIMWFDDCRFAFEPVSAPRSLTNTQGMQTNC